MILGCHLVCEADGIQTTVLVMLWKHTETSRIVYARQHMKVGGDLLG